MSHGAVNGCGAASASGPFAAQWVASRNPHLTLEIDMEAKSTETFEQGWAARPFAEKFPELPAGRARWLDQLNRSLTDVYLSGLITDSVADAARRKKFPKIVSKELEKARSAAKAAQ